MSSLEKPWFRSYPRGMPRHIDCSLHPSLVHLFEWSARRYAPLPAYKNFGRTLSYAAIEELSRHFAGYLQNVVRLAPGDRIALMLPNVLQYPVALFGALRAGLVVVNVNPLYTTRELQEQLADAGTSAIVVLENFAHKLAELESGARPRAIVVTGLGDLLGFPRSLFVNGSVRYLRRLVPTWHLPGAVRFKAALALGRRHRATAVGLTPGDPAFLQYTGGTTGIAKAAVLTHGNVVANVLQAHAWLSDLLEEGREVVVTALPLYHIFALLANCLLFTRLGGLNLLITNPRDLPGFVATLRRQRFTALSGVNTLFNALLNTPGFERLDFSSFKLALGGGMAVQRAVAQRWKHVTGVTLLEAYGLTEASPAVAINPCDLAQFNGCVGLPLPDTDIAIRDEQGHDLPPGRPGELCVRGPQVMSGYWQRPDETALALSADGWLRTGDIAVLEPSGYLRIVDRSKDVIVVSGFNVYPNEVESVAAAHPGVREAAAVGVPDANSGEAVKLVVVRADPALTAEALLTHCRRLLTAYKLPRVIEFRDALPKSNVGKILRRELRSPGLPGGHG